MSSGRPKVHVILDDATLSEPVSAALRRMNAEMQLTTLERLSNHSTNKSYDARLVLTRDPGSFRDAKAELLRRSAPTNGCATLVVSDDGALLAERSVPLTSELTWMSRPSTDDLVRRIEAMCLAQQQVAALQNEVAILRERDNELTAGISKLEHELRLASQLQRELMKASQPDIRGMSLRTLQVPADSVSGDIYRISRLDADHVSIAVVDAAGHGVAAALVGEYIQRAVIHAERIFGTELCRHPDAMLRSVNEVLVRADLPNCEFVAMLFAVIEESTRTIRWSRGGAPFPIVVAQHGKIEEVRGNGPLIGVTPGATFDVHEHVLADHDVVIFHTDGTEQLDTITLSADGQHARRPDWASTLSQDQLPTFWGELEAQIENRRRDANLADDVTILALHCDR